MRTIALVLALLVTACGAHTPETPMPSTVSPPPLTPCPSSPNCVSSEATDPSHFVDPLPVVGNGPATMRRLRALIEATPRTRIVQASDTAIDAEYRSWLFRFVDDVALRSDPTAGVIQVRSASRTGYYDFGVNRQRVEALRQALIRDLAESD